MVGSARGANSARYCYATLNWMYWSVYAICPFEIGRLMACERSFIVGFPHRLQLAGDTCAPGFVLSSVTEETLRDGIALQWGLRAAFAPRGCGRSVLGPAC